MTSSGPRAGRASRTSSGTCPTPTTTCWPGGCCCSTTPRWSWRSVEDHQGLVALTAHDGENLRHLAVRPDHWGAGLGREGFHRAAAAGAQRLWVLADNGRARRLYESLGWAPTGDTQECPWPPFPTELEYAAP